MKNILITICARGGSKGIPGKNIKEVGGVPLLAYTVKLANEFSKKYNAEIILSSDSEDIIKVGEEYGLSSEYVRPDYLANDTCGKPDAIKDAMLWAEKEYGKAYDYIVDLDVTSPIRTLEDIEKCLRMIEENKDALTVFSVNPCARNPYFNMVQEQPNGYYSVVLGGMYTTRQSAPKVFDMNASIYVYRREALEGAHPKAVTIRSLAYVMNHICFDLDEPSDYDYLAYLIENKKINI